MNKRATMQLALDALELLFDETRPRPFVAEAITTLRAELEKPDPEPIGYFIESLGNDYCKHRFEQFADKYANDPDIVPLYRKEEI